MTSAAIVNDVEITANVPGIVVDNSGITISNSEKKDNDIIKCGSLWKRSSGIATARVSSRGKYFVLTKAALEYYRNEKCDKLKGSYPLASISCVSAIGRDGSTFKIEFPDSEPLLLQAGDGLNCAQWIKAIQEGIQRWSSNDSTSRDDSVFESDALVQFPSQSVPKKSISDSEAIATLSGEFAMIKYSRAGTASIPHERVFKLDSHNLHIMWRRARKGYSYKSTLELKKVVEVRCGQQTRNFNQFPYLEVEKQSFSLMFPREQGEWSSLMSLDLICDSVLAAQSWKRGLKALIYGDEDQKPLRDLYKHQDPTILYLRRVWSTMEDQGQISYENAYNFVQNLSPDVNKRHLKNVIRNIARTQRGSSRSSNSLSWECFLVLFDSLIDLPGVHEIYRKYLKTFPDLGLTPQEFKDFLETEQKEKNISLKSCVDLIEYHDKPHYFYKIICARGDPSAFQNSRRLLSYHGFLSFLRSSDNSAFSFDHFQVHQDMDRPLSDYFINSSHNTYLTAHQLKGLSSCEAYVHVLQQGGRCLEVDCWDGPDEPIVTHGLTLTSKIRFRDVIKVIKEYAFETNPYPVILSLENHCSEEQQSIMANMFVTEFDDLLATEDLSENNILPSPNKLLRKIILKGRATPKKKSKAFRSISSRQFNPPVRSGFRSSSQISIQSQGSVSSKTTLHHTSSLDAINRVSQEDALSLNAEDVQVPLGSSMSCLIVYCRAVPYKRHEFNENCCEMHSFNENTFNDLHDRSPEDLLYISRKKLLRTYPKGSRVESSNFNPMPMWKLGIHMASLNFQKPDSGMHINQGFFRTNGSCGYVLKPPHLRRNVVGEFPSNLGRNSSKHIILKIKVLNGHFVDTDIVGNSPISLEVEAVGSEVKTTSFITEAAAKFYNPQWKECEHSLVLTDPELCVLYFKLYSVHRSSRMVLQNAIPVSGLKQGLRYIPFKTLTGASLDQSGIFVSLSFDTTEEQQPARKASKTSFIKPRGRMTSL